MKRILMALALFAPITAYSQSSQTEFNQFVQKMKRIAPDHFVVVSKEQDERGFNMAFIPSGESEDEWSELIAFSGDSTGDLIETMDSQVQILHEGCSVTPVSFYQVLDEPNMNVAFIGCSDNGQGVSVEKLTILYKEGEGMFSIQWYEHGESSTRLLDYDEAKWGERMSYLAKKINNY